MRQCIEDVGIQIYRQSGAEDTLMQQAHIGKEWGFTAENADVTLEEESEGGCLTAFIKVALRAEPFRENDGFACKNAVKLSIKLKRKPSRMTAMYLHRDWWTRPAFLTEWAKIPERTQVVYLDYGDCYGCLLLMAGKEYKANACGGEEGVLTINMTSYCAGGMSFEEPVFVFSEADSLFEAVQIASRKAACLSGALLRDRKELPEMFEYLGWCSWDAFYTDINEEKVRQKAAELKEKSVPARWILLDDGWLSVRENRLYDLAPEKEKFPEGFAGLTKDLKKDSTIDWVGVWHSLGGYWGGIEPESEVYRAEKDHLYKTRTGKILPVPGAEAGYGFFRDWYEYLRREGIDFVKVDGQSAIKNHYMDDIPVSHAARETHKALEGAASAYMGGRLINCMGMAMENILGRQGSALSRNSDDFVPDNPTGFAEHLLQNVYNAPYHSMFYECDWDMFWTFHQDAAKHAVLRAVSGGPVYVSDRIGDTIREAVMPLCYEDGRLLRMERPALPSADCMFADPLKEGLVKLTNLAECGIPGKRGGAVAVYNLTEKEQSAELSASDIFDLPKGSYLCVDGMNKKVLGIVSHEEFFPISVDKDGFALYLFVPYEEECAVLGLTEKYISFMGVEDMIKLPDGFTAVVTEHGPFAFYTAKKVRSVKIDGMEQNEVLKEVNGCYRVEVPNRQGRMLVEVKFD